MFHQVAGWWFILNHSHAITPPTSEPIQTEDSLDILTEDGEDILTE